MIQKYLLLGTYEDEDHHNIEVLATSDNKKELEKIWDNIDLLMQEVVENTVFRDETPTEISNHLMDQLDMVYLRDDISGYIHNIKVIGIYEAKDVSIVEVYCKSCGKRLFRGTNQDKKGEIIYCEKCAVKKNGNQTG